MSSYNLLHSHVVCDKVLGIPFSGFEGIPRQSFSIIKGNVVELVDTGDLKSLDCKIVGVRVPSLPPFLFIKN